MTSVITGDVIHSQKLNPKIWLEVLKQELNTIGSNPLNWEIYRGDSFQVEVSNHLEVIEKAIKIKASLKSLKGIDVRMAIGIGDKTHSAEKITESNGTAFVFSGEQFESLVKERKSLAIASPSKKIDSDINLLLKLALIAMDNWSVNSAQMVKISMENSDKSQKDLGEMLRIKQNAVSNRLKRAYYDEISELLIKCQSKLKEII